MKTIEEYEEICNKEIQEIFKESGVSPDSQEGVLVAITYRNGFMSGVGVGLKDSIDHMGPRF